MVFSVIQEQFLRHSSSELTPTIQSGLGPSMESTDITWCFLSNRNTANVLPFTFGYHRPRALMMVRILPDSQSVVSTASHVNFGSFDRRLTSALSSDSSFLVAPCSATLLTPSEANPSYSHILKSAAWDAPIMSEKWVNHSCRGGYSLSGNPLGCVYLDHSPSKVISYLASSQAQHSSSTSGCSSSFSCSANTAHTASNFTLPSWHSSFVNSPSSIYQESRFSTTCSADIPEVTYLKTTHPDPAGGATHSTLTSALCTSDVCTTACGQSSENLDKASPNN
ncbi:unnamed protein product [Ixodes pacificus]